MAKRKPRVRQKPKGRTNWLPVVAAYAVCVGCAALGVLVLIFGKPEVSPEGEVIQGAIPRIGITLIVLGLLATGLTGYLHWARTRPEKKR